MSPVVACADICPPPDREWNRRCKSVYGVWDRDLDIFYLARTVRLREQTVFQHVNAVRSWRLRCAWPHDGRQQTLAGAGVCANIVMPVSI
jgi:hypothetical protein